MQLGFMDVAKHIRDDGGIRILNFDEILSGPRERNGLPPEPNVKRRLKGPQSANTEDHEQNAKGFVVDNLIEIKKRGRDSSSEEPAQGNIQ